MMKEDGLNALITKSILATAFLFCSTMLAANVTAAEADSLLSFNNTPQDTVKINVLLELASRLQQVDHARAIKYAEAALTQSQGLAYQRGKFGAIHRLVCIYNTRGESANAMQFVKSIVSTATETGDLHSVALAKAELGITYSLLHSELQAFKELTEAIEIFRGLKDRENLLRFSIRLGDIYADHNNIGFAKRYYAEALKACNDNLANHNEVNIHLAALCQQMQNFPASLIYLNNAVEYFRASGDESMLADALVLQGKALSEMSQTDGALKAYHEAESIARIGKDDAQLVSILAERGFALHKNDNRNAAIDNFSRALAIAVSSGRFKELPRIYAGLISCYEATGDYELATKYERLLSSCKDSINTIEQNQKYSALKLMYDTALSENAIERLKSENTNTLFLISLSVVLTILVIIIFALLIRHYQSTIKNTEQDKYTLKRLLSKKIVQENTLKSELDSKAKELTSFTLDMIRKKQIFETIRAALKEIKQNPDVGTSPQFNHLMEKIDSCILQDREWNNFNKYFEQVHPDFFRNLSARYPDLNDNDQRLCALIRLNLTSKQIASVMDIASESAKVAKYRLRKKIGLDASEDFETFFRKLSSPASGEARKQLVNEYLPMENNLSVK